MSYYDGGTTLYSDLDDLYQPSPELSTSSHSGYSAIPASSFYWITLVASAIIWVNAAGLIHNWDRCLSWHGGDNGDAKDAARAFTWIGGISLGVGVFFFILSVWALARRKSFSTIGKGIMKRASKSMGSFNRDYEINEMQARMGVDPRDEAVSQLV